MPIENKNILAVIPARGGSKGIPGKNMRKICGKTLIEIAYECIQSTPWIDATVLSTDDDCIADHGKSIGIDIPFMRPADLATDNAKSIDVWIHAWKFAENYYQKTFSVSVLLEPTSPMRLPGDIQQALQTLLTSDANSVATVSRTPGHYTPHKTLEVNDDGFIQPYISNGLQYTIRQDIPSYYHRNGICYAATRSSLVENHNLMEHQCVPLIIDRPVINIDEDIDLKFAEFLATNR